MVTVVPPLVEHRQLRRWPHSERPARDTATGYPRRLRDTQAQGRLARRRTSDHQFVEVFLNADPNGTTPVPRSALIESLPQRRQLFATIGLTETHLTAISQTTLDEHYTLVATEWAADLEGGDSLPLSSTFLLRREAGSLRIVLYLNHLDIVAAVREHRAGQSAE